MNSFCYVGNELDFFSQVPFWRRYLSRRISRQVGKVPYLVEVGSGIGSNAPFLGSLTTQYIGIEPDKKLISVARQSYLNYKFINGYSDEISRFIFDVDVVCLIDVLEHIEDDKAEILKISGYLKPLSKIVILVPAHLFLYSEFDRSVGHFRRYSKNDLIKLIPENLQIVSCEYLDSVGFLLSVLSKLFNMGNAISKKTVKIWHWLMPVSILLDLLSKHMVGKSILLVAEVGDSIHESRENT